MRDNTVLFARVSFTLLNFPFINAFTSVNTTLPEVPSTEEVPRVESMAVQVCKSFLKGKASTPFIGAPWVEVVLSLYLVTQIGVWQVWPFIYQVLAHVGKVGTSEIGQIVRCLLCILQDVYLQLSEEAQEGSDHASLSLASQSCPPRLSATLVLNDDIAFHMLINVKTFILPYLCPSKASHWPSIMQAWCI